MATKLKKRQGLGDAIHKITKTLKIKECDGCKKRRETFNRLRIPRFKF